MTACKIEIKSNYWFASYTSGGLPQLKILEAGEFAWFYILEDRSKLTDQKLLLVWDNQRLVSFLNYSETAYISYLSPCFPQAVFYSRMISMGYFQLIFRGTEDPWSLLLFYTMAHFEICPFSRKPLLGCKFGWTEGKRYFELLFILKEKTCCLLFVCGKLVFSLFPSACRICDILCRTIPLLSVAEKEPVCIELEVHQLGCPQKKSLRVWRPQWRSSVQRAEGICWKPPASVTKLCSIFLLLEDGNMQSFASMPVKPAWPHTAFSKCWLRGPPPNKGRNPPISSLLIFLPASSTLVLQGPREFSHTKLLWRCAALQFWCIWKAVQILWECVKCESGRELPLK